MRDLPEEQRQVLELAYYQGLTQSEIALATGIPLGTVKTRTLLAMKKLRAALRGEIGELL
jgi:RNA polymerase sigma-70 factor (ECF subfamily)